MRGRYPFLFTNALMQWHADNPRPLPWKQTDDPYKIWLSEIILQQTQVSQGIPYYKRFVETFPTVQELASAPIDDVLKLWQGLGYNSRARNLHMAAQMVADEMSGYFPNSYDGLLKLKGVGEYTAAAVASFAFGEHVPVVDTNVIRLVCRILGITDLPSRVGVRREIRQFLQEAITSANPAEFNQAIMNFGAIHCRPKAPLCTTCPFREDCIALNGDLVDRIPAKPIRKKRRERFFHFAVLHDNTGMVLRKRVGNDIWQGMYDFPAHEAPESGLFDLSHVVAAIAQPALAGTPRLVFTDKQILSHQRIHASFYELQVDNLSGLHLSDHLEYVQFSHLRRLPVPKIVDCYLRANSILL